MFQRFYPETKLGDEFVAAVRAKTAAVTAADLQQAFIANMTGSDKDVVEYRNFIDALSKRKLTDVDTQLWKLKSKEDFKVEFQKACCFLDLSTKSEL